MKVIDKETGEESVVDYTVDKDECNRPQTTLEGLAGLPRNYLMALHQLLLWTQNLLRRKV